jgi:hypothetical protein
VNQTLDQLRKEFTTPCPTLKAVRERYFSHITSDTYLMRKINSGSIQLKVTRLGGRQGQRVVYLHDLADYLELQATRAA